MTPNSSNKAPLWIIAFSLLTIAICLVALVLRSFTGREPEPAATAADSPAKEAPTRDRLVRIVSPARAASAPSEASDSNSTEPAAESPTQTVVQTSQTIVITPPLRGLALGAKTDATTNSQSAPKRTGVIAGFVSLGGKPPPETPLIVNEVPECAQLLEKPPTTRNYVVGRNNGLADVIVRASPHPHSPFRPDQPSMRNPRTVEMVFTNCELKPYLIAISPADKLILRNMDTTKHELTVKGKDGWIHSTLEARVGLDGMKLIEGLVETNAFVEVRCELHSWEQAFLSLMSYPFFAVTDARGRFEIGDVPMGKYQVEAMHRHATGTSAAAKDLMVLANSTNGVVFQLFPKH